MKKNISEDSLSILEEPEEDTVAMSYDIATYPSDYTVNGIVQMYLDKDITIPNYQREFVWSIKQSSMLIDSFLSGLPVPPVFLYIDEANKSIVIDGQQRIMSVVFFLEGYFGVESEHHKRVVFRLKGLGNNHPNIDKRFIDLDMGMQRKLKQAVLRAVNIKQLSPAEDNTSAYHIFERLNTGGTPLTPQEIRNCVFMGQFSDELKELNKDANWRKILGKKLIDRHQKDVELLLRVFALSNYLKNYDKPMTDFLNKALKKNQGGGTQLTTTFLLQFPVVLRQVVEAFGDKPFHLRGRLNISALDSIMCVLFLNHQKIDAQSIGAKFASLKDSVDFANLLSINPTDSKSVIERFAFVNRHFFNNN